MAEIKDNTIDLIYCDILYGTGRKFKDYQDLKPIRSEIESHYIPRIKEMHRILKPTGSIYLQMDWRINHWIRCIMDDIFGYEQFKNEIIWSYRSQGLGKTYIKQHDNILFYTKTNEFTFNNEFERIRFEKKFMDVKQDKFGYYRDVRIRDVWDDIKFLNSLQNESKNYEYDTKKPIKLIERIIKTSSNEGDLIADFYAGAFTTAHACKNLNRSFIGCDINPNCFEKTKRSCGLLRSTARTKQGIRGSQSNGTTKRYYGSYKTNTNRYSNTKLLPKQFNSIRKDIRAYP